ncbi:hypothetical protein APY03_0968 [Variovorax sp. WDL1]|nr:hypothetical protein APY03_0968 [Variovorax sp. WDL1]
MAARASLGACDEGPCIATTRRRAGSDFANLRLPPLRAQLPLDAARP